VPHCVSGLVAALLPLLILGAGFAIMGSRPAHGVVQQIAPPINTRPYSAAEMASRWGTLAEQKALDSERYMLKVDLLFPLFYGAAFAASLWFIARGLRFQGIATLMVPVLLMVLADWVENTVQLMQLARFETSKDVSTPWLALASIATCLKMTLVTGLIVLNLGTGVWLAFWPPKD
jgi:hypothetical protein